MVFNFLFLSIFFSLANLVQNFNSIASRFNSSVIGKNIIVREAIQFNSSQNIIVSFNQNGSEFISKYSIQSNQLIIQYQVPVVLINSKPQPISVLCAISNQTKLLAFFSTSFKIYTLNITTLAIISVSTTTVNISQMIQSTLNNKIYFVNNGYIFGYLAAQSGNTATSGVNVQSGILSTIILRQFTSTPYGKLKMSKSVNQSYIAISSTTLQNILIYNILTNTMWDNLTISGLGTIAHQWATSQTLYIMPATSGLLYEYNVTLKNSISYNIFSSGTKNVFSFHVHTLTNLSMQIIIGANLGLTNSFLQVSLTPLSIIDRITKTYNQSLIDIKYDSKVSKNGILIFQSFIDSMEISTIKQNTSLTQQELLMYKNFRQISTSNSLLKSLNKVPGNRKLLQPIFMFFVNFDDIQLYTYHERNYDFVLDSLFSEIQVIETQKWKTIKFQSLWGLMGINTTYIKQNFDNLYNYTSWKFLEVQGNSSGFMINTLNLFLSNMLLIFLMYVSLRTLFFLLFKYEVSKVLRQFSFWPFLYFMMIDGNLQFLTYMFFCELQHFFTFNFSNRCGLVFMLLILFLLIILISCSHLILREAYGILAKYFFDDTKVSIEASIYLSLQFGYRNLLLGAVHALFNQLYTLKLSFLLIIQILFLLNNLFYFKRRGFFNNSTRVMVNIITALLRIGLIFTFFLDKNGINQSDDEMTDIQKIIQKVHLILVQVYLILAIFSIIFELSKLFYQIIHYAINSRQKLRLSSEKNTLEIFSKTNMLYQIKEKTQENIFQPVDNISKENVCLEEFPIELINKPKKKLKLKRINLKQKVGIQIKYSEQNQLHTNTINQIKIKNDHF